MHPFRDARDQGIYTMDCILPLGHNVSIICKRFVTQLNPYRTNVENRMSS